MNHQYCVGDFFLPGWLGESLNLLNTVCLLYKAEPVLTIDHAAFVGRIWREGCPPAEEVQRRKGVVSLWNKRPPEGLCMAHLCWCWWWSADGAQGRLSTSSRPGSDFGHLSVSWVFKSCFCSFFFFLNKHDMVGTNTSLGEGQGFRIENNFHKNIKNGKELLFKKFAIQTKWQLLKISIKKRKRICCQWYPFS